MSSPVAGTEPLLEELFGLLGSREGASRVLDFLLASTSRDRSLDYLSKFLGSNNESVPNLVDKVAQLKNTSGVVLDGGGAGEFNPVTIHHVATPSTPPAAAPESTTSDTTAHPVVDEEHRKAFLDMVDFVIDDEKRQKADHKAILQLLQEQPLLCREIFDIQWDNGDQRRLHPLHILCCFEPSVELIQFVYHAYPEALQVPEAVRGTRPFHYACTFKASLDVINFLLEKDWSCICTPRKDGMIPLGLAVYFQAPYEIVNRLVEAWPLAARRADTGKWTMLHAAAHGRATLQVTKRMYDLFPESIDALDDMKRTPLHQACWKRGNPEVVAFLLEKAPHILFQQDDGDETPLFRAVRNQSLEVVKLLLPAKPPLDELGATLLHFASLDNTPDVVEYLVQKHPDMALTQTKCRDRYTPLHSCCHFNNTTENMQVLVKYAPKALIRLNGKGRTPLEVAQERDPSDGKQVVVDYMLRVTPQPDQKLHRLNHGSGTSSGASGGTSNNNNGGGNNTNNAITLGSNSIVLGQKNTNNNNINTIGRFRNNDL